jgi:hypothetical protein
MIKLHRSVLALALYGTFLVGLIVCLALGKIGWVEFAAGFAALNLPAAFRLSNGDDEQPPKGPSSLLPALILSATMIGAAALPGCSLLSPKQAAKSALDAAAITCIFASSSDDADALSKICGVAKDLIPLIRELISQRNGARKAGVVWQASDAGAP